jgi:hypothetical protein
MEYPDKTLDLLLVTNNVYHIMLYQVHLTWVGFELATFVVIGTDCIVSCKSKYHTITLVTSNRSRVLSGYSGFLHQQNWLPWYNWNIVESCWIFMLFYYWKVLCNLFISKYCEKKVWTVMVRPRSPRIPLWGNITDKTFC